MKDITVLVELPVYSRSGSYIGHVKNCILDLEARRVEGLVITRTNPDLVEGGHDVAIPFRWVAGFDRVMILDFFPDEVTAPAGTADPVADDDLQVVEVQAV